MVGALVGPQPGHGAALIQATESGITLRLRVQPRASHTEVVGPSGGMLRIRVAAPPVGGEANQELLRFLAKRLGVGRSAVTIRSGAGARCKVAAVEGIGADEAARRLGLQSPCPGGDQR